MEIYEVMQQFDIEMLKKFNDVGRNKGAEGDDLFWICVSSLIECVNGVMSRELIGGISEGEKLDLFTSIVASTIMIYDSLTEREKGEMSSSVAKANELMKRTLEKIVDISEKDSGSFSIETGDYSVTMQTLFTKTGSDGNCTVFQDHKGMMLAVDCGIPGKEVNRGMDYKLSSVKHCLITHAHGDHTKYINDFVQRGIHVYMSQETKSALNLCDGYYIHTVKDKEQFQIGDSFIVLPFNVPHCNSDGSPCTNYGFLIYSTADHEKIFFATDCQFIPQKFRKLDRIFIECNYRDDETTDLSDMEDMNMYVEKRRLISHMSEKVCIEFLKKQDLSQTKEIRLLHLSSSQYYLKDTIKQEVEESIGKAVKI